MRQKYLDSIQRYSLYIFFGLLGYMPLHILISTWFGTTFGLLDAAKVAKDIVLVVGFIGALAVSVGKPWLKELLRNRLLWLIGAYVVLTVLLASMRSTDADAELLGVVYNTRFLLFFVYGMLLSRLSNPKVLRRMATTIVLGVGIVVLFFGIVQYAVLPNDALSHIGYKRANGVLPAFFIDDKPDLERVMSTLRDPNSLGSYIIIISSLALALRLRTKNKEKKSAGNGLLILSGLCLWYTFSRSAWLGFAAAIGAVLLYGYGRGARLRIKRQHALAGLACATVVAMLGLFSLRNSYFVQNVVFHADESTVLEDPNQLRTRFWRESVDAVVDTPLGHGPGTAGLASIRNNVQGTVLNENYYLQIAYEVGLLGLALFLVIVGWIGVRLLRLSNNSELALGLFASLIGLTLTNFLVHIWSNEAIAYTWWGASSLALAVPNRRKKVEES